MVAVVRVCNLQAGFPLRPLAICRVRFGTARRPLLEEIRHEAHLQVRGKGDVNHRGRGQGLETVIASVWERTHTHTHTPTPNHRHTKTHTRRLRGTHTELTHTITGCKTSEAPTVPDALPANQPWERRPKHPPLFPCGGSIRCKRRPRG